MKMQAAGGTRGPGNGWLLALGLALLAGMVGCIRPVPALINLYDLSGYNLMQCNTLPQSQGAAGQGPLRCSAVDGEHFQGEWMTLYLHRNPAPISENYLTSLPQLTGNALVSRWGWATSYGVDLEAVTGSYGVFLLYGNHGTVIDGVFTFRMDTYGIIGAAVDNRGHRYKVMG
jgi:hypothetical protein